MHKLFISFFALIAIISCNKLTSKENTKKNKELKQVKKLLYQGEYGAALDKLEKIKKHQQKNKEFWNTYGMVLRYNSYLDLDPSLRQKEISAFEKAVKLDKEFISARMNLAVSLWERGQQTKAVKHFRKVLELNPSHKDAKTIQNRIKQTNTQNTPKKDSGKNHTP